MKLTSSPPYQLHSIPSPLGKILLAASDAGLRGLWFEGQQHVPDFSDTKLWQRGEHRFTQAAAEVMQRYFAGERVTVSKGLPFDLSFGTSFQQSVWQALLHIPRGGSTSYGAIAHSISNPAAVRAVGAAIGRNPISILVPCHRVLGKDGSLTGYAGGLERKVALLRIEGVLI
jgi:methylated-DNA-[protein]-cysteine S-methyltransferase